MNESVGQMIAKGREAQGLSQRELANLCNVSNTEISRIESGEREVPNPKTLRKISKYIGVNYNDLMYASGLGIQVTPLNPFLKEYYSELRGTQIDDALINTLGSIDNWKEVVNSFQKKLNDKSMSDLEKEKIEEIIEDTEYQINTGEEIVKLLQSAKTKERLENAKRNK